MSLALVLERQPQAVGRARAWVVDSLERLDREDLVDAAELGVSELVTNAILHATPPITVRLGGTRAHPRVEVHDHSIVPPRLNGGMPSEERLLSTVGRGLGIVAIYSQSWGAEVSSGGKVVWFEPAADPELDPDALDPSGPGVFDMEEAVRRLQVPPDPTLERFTLVLRNMPVQVFAQYRVWYEDLRRELRLLAMNHPDEYPVAQRLSDLALQVERDRRQASGVDRLDQAIRDGVASMDLEYDIPVTVPATMAAVLDLMRQVHEFAAADSLLTLPATEQQIALQEWYLGEFIRQGRGEPPLAWDGGSTVEEPRR